MIQMLQIIQKMTMMTSGDPQLMGKKFTTKIFQYIYIYYINNLLIIFLHSLATSYKSHMFLMIKILFSHFQGLRSKRLRTFASVWRD